MRKLITFILCLCFANFINAQKLDLNLIDKLVKMSFVSMDEYMVEGYGFDKLEKESEKRINAYARKYENDYNSTIIVKIYNSKDTPNVIEIFLAKNFNIRDIKDNLLSRGYEYNGSNKYGFVVYKKGKSTYLFSEKPNDVGASQIMVITE